MREKPSPLLVKISDIKQVVASAENYSHKRMLIVFNNTEYRLQDIKGINPKYYSDLREITNDCIELIQISQKECFDTYKLKVNELMEKIINDNDSIVSSILT